MKFFASATPGTRARWFRASVTSASMLMLLGLILFGAGCSDDEGGDVSFPDPPDETERNWIFDVFGTGPNDVYAVGNRGAMFHYDGSAWSFVDLGAGTPITNIWGPGDGTLYAVGHEGRAWRNSGGDWSDLETGTDKDLYAIGLFEDEIYASGAEGTLRRLSGNSMISVDDVVILRDGETGAPKDTLSLVEDVYSMVTIHHSFIGGAYALPDYEEEIFGLLGTDGMVMALDEQPELYDWRLRPIGNDEFALSEWMLCTTSDAVVTGNNYMGTSEGWIFRLSDSGGGQLDWVMIIPDITVDAGNGIRDMWVDGDNNLYAVTDDGSLVFQTEDFDFVTEEGLRRIFPLTHGGLTGIWGSDSDNIFITGFNEDVIIQASMDFSDTTLVFNTVPLTFPNKGGQSIGDFEDHQGLPRF